ncbi:FmdB family transcriptional regulator [Paracidovorax avenae]|uniref:FmdB family transcriptional regulator n=1 Tax=Paracidovorax avenae TaxID=80867 RepID=UPI000D15CBD7|nr:FmdB family transcriptional regulator [Paracidovorax avenae]AVS89858.1 FmdB family transcriptional regulator [Paracidovorax avenae]AVS96888.1 FmdB family transcriptional regulator [Paracidovorax avenae]AVT10910.1 FmdB family transcriptional regulator [Paracidovorax avenae]
MAISSISSSRLQGVQAPGAQDPAGAQTLLAQVLMALLEGLLQKLSKHRQAHSPQPSEQGGSPASGEGTRSGGNGGGGSGSPSGAAPSAAPAPAPAAAPASGASAAQPAATGDLGSKSVDEAQAKVHPKFLPVLRGDEQQQDAKVQTQADFGRAVDRTAKEYGLDPSVFRAQLQSESGAFTQGFRKAMQHEGDLDRAGDNNTSIGLGQISRKFMDGRDWSADGPGNSRVGGQKVPSEQYEKSVTVQLRMAASNMAQRIADHGGLKQGLSYYVSGDANPANPKAQEYLQHIDEALRNPEVMNPGR